MTVMTADHFKWHGRGANKVFTIDTWTYLNGQVCTYDIQMIVGP